MKRDAALKLYVTEVEVARALGVSRQAVEQWGPVVPLASAYRLEVISGRRLKVDLRLYDNRGRPVQQAAA